MCEKYHSHRFQIHQSRTKTADTAQGLRSQINHGVRLHLCKGPRAYELQGFEAFQERQVFAQDLRVVCNEDDASHLGYCIGNSI